MSLFSPAALSQLRVMYVIRGMASIFLAILLLVWPEIGVVTIVSILWIYLLLDGGLQISNGLRLRRNGVAVWALLIIQGLFEMAGGIYFLFHLDTLGHTAALLLSFTLLMRGLLELLAQLEPAIAPGQRLLLFVLSACSIIFAILLFGISTQNPLDIVKVFAIYELTSGVLRIITGYSFNRQMQAAAK